MQVEHWLKVTFGELSGAGIGTARLDALVLLEDSTGKDRSWLLANPDYVLTDSHLKKLKGQIEKRSKHIPLAQIRGKTEFYGREFIINKYVLEPRPESETMIEILIKLRLPRGFIIADIGTGSGALGITASLELPDTEVILSDIDNNCLKIAKKNADKHSATVEIIESNLLEKIDKADVLLANLPYVPDSYEINRAALNEPRRAIFGGEDGLDLCRKLFEQISSSIYKPLYILTECLPFQHKSLSAIASRAGYHQTKEEDFIQLFEPK